MRLFSLFWCCVLALAAQQQPGKTSPSASPQPVIRAGTEEVLLDVIVRDKKGRPIHDLKAEEIEVYEDGARQKLTAFRLVTGAREATAPSAAELTPGGAQAEQKHYDPARQLRLVSLVFDALDDEARRLARQAALEFLKNPLDQNVYFAVFTIDLRLNVLQQFTNDRELLYKAIDTATTKQYTDFSAQSDAIRKELEKNEEEVEALESIHQPGRSSPASGFGAGMAAASMARMTLNVLRNAETTTREQQARSSIFSLLSIIREQGALPGRKTVLYFCEGLAVPDATIEQFRSVISAANRANVSVYGVDARGLISDAQNKSSTAMLASAANSSRRQQTFNTAVTADQAKVFDTARDSIHANKQMALDELSTNTGGFLIANTNDFRAPFRRLSEDIETYYQLAYVPQITEYDGRFRSVAVKVKRANARVQTRNGYFALPPNEGMVFAFELPLLRALTSATLPHDFPFHAAALRFGEQSGKLEYALVLEVPMKDVFFIEEKERDRYKAHISMLALIKNPKGEIVRRFSHDVPVSAPRGSLDAFRRGHFIQTYHVDLAPGRYTLETAVMDQEATKASAKRVSLVVPVEPSVAVGISSLALIRRIEPEAQSAQAVPLETDDPFRFHGGKVVPTLDEAIPKPTSELSYYFVIYPLASSAEKPRLTMMFLREGKLVAKASPELPAPDQTGVIRYVASLPLTSFTPGDYEVRAIVRQGTTSAEEHTAFSINP